MEVLASWARRLALTSAVFLPQGLLLCLFGLGQAGGLALFCQLVDAGDLFLCHGDLLYFQAEYVIIRKANLSVIAVQCSPKGRAEKSPLSV